MNTTSFIGPLTKDLEVRTTSSGPVTDTRVAVDGPNDRAVCVTVTVFGAQGDAIAEHVAKAAVRRDRPAGLRPTGVRTRRTSVQVVRDRHHGGLLGPTSKRQMVWATFWATTAANYHLLGPSWRDRG